MGLREVTHAVAGVTGQAGSAVVGLLHAGQQAQHGGFAGAVFADDGHVFAMVDGEVNSVEELAVPVAMGNAGKVQVVSQEESSQVRSGWQKAVMGTGDAAAERGCAQDFIAPA